jgi:hypothetical protein
VADTAYQPKPSPKPIARLAGSARIAIQMRLIEKLQKINIATVAMLQWPVPLCEAQNPAIV